MGKENLQTVEIQEKIDKAPPPSLQVEHLFCSVMQEGKKCVLVSDISFSLFSKKTVAIVGESGSGKTTTALSILRLFSRWSSFEMQGQVLFDGKDLLTLPEHDLRKIRGKDIGMVFQDPASALNPVFSIGTQIAEMYEIHLDIEPEDAEERAIKMLQKVGLSRARECFDIYPHQLSGGMKQRAAIAMAIALSPKILIADEPTTALDVTVQKEVLQLLKDLQQETNMAILLITHDMGVVAEMADQVAVMYASQMVEFGPITSVFERKMHPYTQALFAAKPTKKNRKKMLPAAQGIAPQATKKPSGCPFHPRCPFAMPKCREGEVPKFYDAQDPSHWAKCWLFEEEKA